MVVYCRIMRRRVRLSSSTVFYTVFKLCELHQYIVVDINSHYVTNLASPAPIAHSGRASRHHAIDLKTLMRT